MPPNNNNPYEFITNPQSPKRQARFGRTPLQRTIIVVGSVSLLLIIFVAGASLLNRSANEQKDKLVRLAQTQAEIARVAEIGEKDGVGRETKTLAAIANQGLISAQNETTELLAQRGTKLNNSSLSALKSKQTDAELEAATSRSSFDDTFNSVLDRLLEDYMTQLKSAQTSGNNREKEVLSANFQEAELLLNQKPSL